MRTSLKSQVLADFVAKLTLDPSTTSDQEELWWTLMVDGASNVKGAGIGSIDGEINEQSFHLGFNASNNEAE